MKVFDENKDLVFLADDDDEEMKRIDAELKAHEDLHKIPDKPYLPQLTEQCKKYCLVVDLDETLIHFNEKENYYLV